MSDGAKAVFLNYTAVSDDRKELVANLKLQAAAYYDAIVAAERHLGPQRDFSIAKTKLQEASMWVTRGITNPE